jgi:ketopantoate reductase
MKVCIYGVGAIGGYLGVQLARAGADVSLVARGAHLAAVLALVAQRTKIAGLYGIDPPVKAKSPVFA